MGISDDDNLRGMVRIKGKMEIWCNRNNTAQGYCFGKLTVGNVIVKKFLINGKMNLYCVSDESAKRR